MTKQEYRRACTEVEVLCDLLACAIRSHCPPTAAAKHLEDHALRISDRFAAIAKTAITTAAQRRMFERNWRRLREAR